MVNARSFTTTCLSLGVCAALRLPAASACSRLPFSATKSACVTATLLPRCTAIGSTRMLRRSI
uniref:RxLR effector protein n=1 Tax=Phytophthora fragariae TaxID=53985 RepID=A0A6A3DD66_9STRA|nr:hypothetical protein PF009_g30123 [Phytophthora fragariae]